MYNIQHYSIHIPNKTKTHVIVPVINHNNNKTCNINSKFKLKLH